MFWLVIAALCAGFIGFLIFPLLRRPAAAAKSEAAGQALKARLAEIERDRAAGLLGQEEAAEAVIEAQRAALAIAPSAEKETPARFARFAALAFAGSAPLAALWIYFAIGAPGLIGGEISPPAASAEEAIAAMAPEERQAMIENMVSGLAARLEEDPEDVDGWRMLARSYGALGRNEEAARAWRELLARAEGDADDWRGFAGALLTLGPGEGRAEELGRAIARLQELNPDDPMALYFLGLMAREAGEDEQAVEYWRRLLEIMPADAPVRPTIEGLIADAEQGG